MLQVGESYEFEDGSVIIVREILVQESGNDRADYYFYGTGNDPVPVDMNVDRFDEEKCKHGINCLQNYRRERVAKMGTFRIQPLHDWASHAADAARTCAVAVKEDMIRGVDGSDLETDYKKQKFKER